MATRFLIFRRPIIAHVENLKNITKPCVSLHNFLMKENFNDYFPDSSEIERNNTGLSNLPKQGSNNCALTLQKVDETCTKITSIQLKVLFLGKIKS